METIVMTLAALPDSEWKVLRSAVEYALNHPGHTPHELIGAVFEHGLPEPDEWDAAVREAVLARSDTTEAAARGRNLTRREYMRIYMRRRRAKQVE